MRFLFTAGLTLAMLAHSARAGSWPLTGSVGAHDPSIIREGNTWWCFATGAGVPIKFSSTGLNWTQGVRLFDAELPWWRTYAPTMGNLDVWAPDLHKFGGRIWCYYCVSEFGRNNSAIGLKSCTSIAAGDWRDDGLVIASSSGRDAYNAIDPSLTTDSAGNPWLAFGSWFDGIHLVQLDPATMKPTGAISSIARRNNGIEAANIVFANGYYYLFVSIDTCCQGVNSTYKISCGRSRNITGPYTDKNNASMLNGGGTILEAGGERWKGPGGQDVYQDGNAWVIARHAYDALNNGRATLLIDDLYWDSESWPTFASTGPPVITLQPVSAGFIPGAAIALSVGAAGPDVSYQWKKDGVTIAGATDSTFSISSATAGDAGTYTVVITNSAGSVTSDAAVIALPPRPAQLAIPNGDRTAQIINLSTRGIVASGENALIAGFVIAGSAPKKLLILASGLNLSRRFGLTGEIGRPQFSVNQNINGGNVVIAENNDWQTSRAEIAALTAQVGAQPLSDSSDPAHGDAGLVITLGPGGYSVVVAPDAKSSNQDGVGLIEIYDATPGDGSRLVNISSRGRIETGARQMFVGVVVTGSGRARLMIRAVGPALKNLGIVQYLANPSQTLFQNTAGGQVAVATNDDWWNSAQSDQISDLSPKLGAFPLGNYSADSVILKLLDPGAYSAIISPGSGAPGIALAEIYEANLSP